MPPTGSQIRVGIHVVNDATVNAWCMPGGKVWCTRASYGRADDNGLAVVMAMRSHMPLLAWK